MQICSELKEFNRIYKEFDDIYHDIASNLHLSDSIFTILYSIFCLGDGCLQRDICAISFISKQTVNSAVQKMIRADHLYLTPGKGKDKHLHLTASGKKLLQETIPPVIQIENHVFEQLTPEESAQLLHLTKKYVSLLRKESKLFIERNFT
ncbi:MAG: winged helix-turn-helix transcriptional regulator [Lachnospiraceae bacterium]|nr:winged helix-turn-helix transcriptional regulator [Lachnospiraceae bacterium]